jgi:hypothetical protein
MLTMSTVFFVSSCRRAVVQAKARVVRTEAPERIVV